MSCQTSWVFMLLGATISAKFFIFFRFSEIHSTAWNFGAMPEF